MYPEWMADAACHGVSDDIMFPATEADRSSARAICAACPVKAECLDYALGLCRNQIPISGIWAGIEAEEISADASPGEEKMTNLVCDLEGCIKIVSVHRANHSSSKRYCSDQCRKSAAKIREKLRFLNKKYARALDS